MDALASAGDEGRGKLRKAPGSRRRALIRRSPNGATRPFEERPPRTEYIGAGSDTTGSETSQYREEKKENSIPSVVASESGIA